MIRNHPARVAVYDTLVSGWSTASCGGDQREAVRVSNVDVSGTPTGGRQTDTFSATSNR